MGDLQKHTISCLGRQTLSLPVQDFLVVLFLVIQMFRVWREWEYNMVLKNGLSFFLFLCEFLWDTKGMMDEGVPLLSPLLIQLLCYVSFSGQFERRVWESGQTTQEKGELWLCDSIKGQFIGKDEGEKLRCWLLSGLAQFPSPPLHFIHSSMPYAMSYTTTNSLSSALVTVQMWSVSTCLNCPWTLQTYDRLDRFWEWIHSRITFEFLSFSLSHSLSHSGFFLFQNTWRLWRRKIPFLLFFCLNLETSSAFIHFLSFSFIVSSNLESFDLLFTQWWRWWDEERPERYERNL